MEPGVNDLFFYLENYDIPKTSHIELYAGGRGRQSKGFIIGQQVAKNLLGFV
jgi:hypothetical protein